MKQSIVIGLSIAIGFGMAACDNEAPETVQTSFEGHVHPELAAHTEEFRKEIIKVTDGVWVAVGFGLANSILIEGEDGVVIVDTMESSSEAEEVKAAFEKITDKPVKGVVITHNHTDHIFGGKVFTGGDPEVQVWAHATTEFYIDKIFNIITEAIGRRSGRMFGQGLSDRDVENAGIGPRLNYKAEEMALARPTHTFEDVDDIEIAGINITLVHAPGETRDQLFVWLPEQRVLMPGDNFYRSFPNLYTIRGTAYRDVMDWVRSLDKMRALRPLYLVPSHTRPLAGEEHIQETLTAYRDAIQYVHDQTIRGMNKGLTENEVVEFVKLPKHLEENQYLKQFYGTVEWSVRSIFNGYLGWFGGDAVTLEQLSDQARSERFVAALTSELSLDGQVRQAIRDGDLLWAAELSDHLVRTDPSSKSAKALKAQVLRSLGERHISANGRHYYIAQATETLGDGGFEVIDRSKIPDDFIADLKMSTLMSALPTKLNAQKAIDKDMVVLFNFTDTGETYTFHVRHGVAEFSTTAPDAPDMTISVSEVVWKDIIFQRRSPALAFAAGDIDVDGGIIRVVRFLGLFET